MRSGFRKALRIGLSRTGITLLQTGGWPRHRTEVLDDLALPKEESMSLERLAILLNGMFADNKYSNLPVTVILADDMARLFMVTPPHNATRLQDCHTAVEMRFQALYGEPISDWRVDSDWDPVQPFLACAVHKTLLKAIEQVATEHRMTLVEIVPQFIAAWNCWHANLDDGAWFGVVNERILTIGAISQQRLRMVRTSSIPSDASHDKQWLPEHLSREALRFNLPTPKQIDLCGYLIGHWPTTATGSLNCVQLDAAELTTDVISISAGAALARSGLRI